MSSGHRGSGGSNAPWETTIELSDGTGSNGAGTVSVRPDIRWRFREKAGPGKLTVRFDEPVAAFVERIARSAIHAADGDPSLADHAHWTFESERQRSNGTDPTILRPAPDGTVAVDVVTFPRPDDVSVGRLERDVRTESRLPAGPVSIDFETLLGQLAETGTEALARYRERDLAGSESYESLRAVIADVEHAADAVADGTVTGFDASLDAYEELILENPTSTEPVHGPIRDEWLYEHALETDGIEQLIDERVRTADAETARRWYKALTMNRDEVAERCLDALADAPDQRAVGALLLFVWDDDRRFAPRAVSILGRLLAEAGSLDGTRESREHVRTQIEELVTRSDHPHVRIAAIEAVSEIGDETAPTVLERALDDPDERVRSAASATLDRSRD